MVFITGHFATQQIANDVIKKYEQQYNKVVLCGSASFNFNKNEDVVYYPLLYIKEKSTLQEQQYFIDLILRALQIEKPLALLKHSATLLDTETVWYNINKHCEHVGVDVVQL